MNSFSDSNPASTVVPEQPAAEAVQGRRELTKQANREAILDAARQVFAELGYEATTVRDIIRRTNLASGTFYNYFRSKEELYHAMHDDGIARFRPLLRQAREAARGDVAVFLHKACHGYFTFLLELQPYARNGQDPESEITRVRFETPESKALFVELRNDMLTFKQAGEMDGVNVDLLAAASIGMAQEIGDLLVYGQLEDVDEAATFCTNLILSGILGMRQV